MKSRLPGQGPIRASILPLITLAMANPCSRSSALLLEMYSQLSIDSSPSDLEEGNGNGFLSRGNSIRFVFGAFRGTLR